MILDEIIAHKRQELADQQAVVPPWELHPRIQEGPPAQDFAAALRGDGVALIAEVKRASPSRGVFDAVLNPVALARTYAANGAAAISVLTDQKFFHGDLDFLPRIRAGLAATGGDAISLPLLRKDFIFDPYQVYASRAYGADALLLIAAVLADGLLTDLMALTDELGMTALVEVHDETELDRVLPLGPHVVGVNNRDLRDFRVDLGTFGRLRPRIPAGVMAVAESGVHDGSDVRRLGAMGADAVLVGEALVTAPDVAAKVRELASAGQAGTSASEGHS
jgi:indole-3-glycerol phosphate synthase